jgi:hypothetical protein
MRNLITAHDSTTIAGSFGNGISISNNQRTSLAQDNTGLIAETSGYGIFIPINNETTPFSIDTCPTDVYIYSLTVSDSKLFAGSFNGEVWSRPITEIVTAVKDMAKNELVSNYQLNQKYSNPFNPSTSLNRQLLLSGFITYSTQKAASKVISQKIVLCQAYAFANYRLLPFSARL